MTATSAALQLTLDGFGETSLPAWVHPRANRECVLEDLRIAYEFQRARRRTIGLIVGPQGLSVRAPRWTPLADVEAFLHEKAAWVVRKLRQYHELQRQSPARIDWVSGARIAYLGRLLTLSLDGTASGPATAMPDDRLVLSLPADASADRVRDAGQAWLMREARARFEQRLAHFAPALGVRWTRLSLSSAGTRWGSASADGRIRLNWRLIHLSPEVIDYVVVHELSHLRVMNHSPQFWDTVAQVLPDYDQRRRALREVRLPAI